MRHLHAAIGLPAPLATGIAGIVGIAIGYALARERLRPIDANPVSRGIAWIYAPTLRLFLRHKRAFLLVPSLIFVAGIAAWLGLPAVLRPVEGYARRLGANLDEIPGYTDLKGSIPGLESDDWIALDEGNWFYMPTLYPAVSVAQATRVLQAQDARIKQIPEVAAVLGKLGRAESALDPAPLAMIETYVMLKPRAAWRPGIAARDIWDRINAVATLPGVTPASPLQPIEGRVVMLQSGIRAPMAVRIQGDDLDGLTTAARSVAEHLRRAVPEVDGRTVNPDIVQGKPYVEFEIDREGAARHGLSVAMVGENIETALGGMILSRTVEGRERYAIRIRYRRDLRERIDELDRLPIVTHDGQVVRLSALARLRTRWGPAMIGSEDGRLVAHVAFAPSGRAGDLETVQTVRTSLHNAQRRGELDLAPGFELQVVGSFQAQIEANRRLMWLVPSVVLINLLIIYLQFRRLPLALAVFTGIPVVFGGGMIALGLAGVELNTAVWIGFIALFGIAIDDGVVLGTYLQQEFRRRPSRTIDDLRAATVEAGLRRIRPCLMTTATTLAALIPVLLSTGRGSDVARSMALPVFGGMVVELISLFVVPVVFCGYEELRLRARRPARLNDEARDLMVHSPASRDGLTPTGARQPSGPLAH